MPDTDWRNGGFGIYIHWPFCAAKCPYCDFNSHVRAEIDQARWRQALLAELRFAAKGTEARRVDSVFFGGGTPSLMDPETVGALLDEIQILWPATNGPEITLEANPTSVEAARFADYAGAGVNRVSIGIQSLRDADLKALGRLHSAAEARGAFDIARAHFDRVSFDLIYARQNQEPQDWRAELHEACAMAVDHLSLYQLTIEDGTRFGDLHARGGLRGLPDDDRSADMYLETNDICSQNGFDRYEVSNYATHGAECRHNLIYWRYGDYLGIGPGAHGRITQSGNRWATETYRQPEAWLKAVESSGHGVKRRDPIPVADQAAEYLLMAMRLREGMDLARYTALGGRSIPADVIAELRAQGLVASDGKSLVAADHGFIILNRIISEIA